MGSSGQNKAIQKSKNQMYISGIIQNNNEFARIQALPIGFNKLFQNKKYDTKLNEFVKEKIIQNYLPKANEQSPDIVFNELKAIEKYELKKIYEKLYKNYENEILKKKELIFPLNINLIDNIIKNENSVNIYKKKIMNKIKSIKNDDSKYPIEYLTVLVV